MPKPQHLDDKLYVNMVLLWLVLVLVLLVCLFVSFLMAFIVHGICPADTFSPLL